ncbi:HAMP domain-containing sensor histidine kinase [Salinigranum marinum]|uniref:ATP-binding response regulator n=1 Tax=Salinigranum marinum TaxID=1515595 RepID=UPI002989BBDE|nr:HAMP domain-containing sensor histidine kinase [Salinigranum marinum]
MWGSPGRTWQAGDAEHEQASPPPVDDFAPVSRATPVSRILLLVAHDRNRTLLADWFDDSPRYDVVDGIAALGDGPAGASDETAPNGSGSGTSAARSNSGVPPEWQRSDGDGGDSDSGDAAGPGRDAAEPGSTKMITALGEATVDLCLVDFAALGRYGAQLERRIERDRPLPLPCLLLASEAAGRRFFAAEQGHERSHLVDDVITTPVEPALLDRRVRAYLGLRRQASELDRRHEQLSLLAQVLRHDIANAATVVTGWGEVLRGEVSPDGVEALERVLRGGQRITELVENSRDLTKLIEAGHDLETEALALGPILRTEVDAIERAHASTTQRVTVDLDAPPSTVEVVAGGMLPSVFANLLSNAVRHGDTETVEISVAVESGPSEVVVRVTDNGPGIPDEQKERVFEPATKRGDSPGDGLGLSLVRRLVESYGGRVWFEDAGGGAVACVALRRVDAR